VRFLGLLRRRIPSGPDCPHRFVGDDQLANLRGRQPLESALELTVDNFDSINHIVSLVSKKMK